MTAALERKFLDAATVKALADQLLEAKTDISRIFARLYNTRGIPNHPLNAGFLDFVLRMMTVGQRDLLWTEWVREKRNEIQNDVEQLEERWRQNLNRRTASDRLRAKWLMWLLTTSARNLRDRVTRALYWFGRGDPAVLLELAEEAATINDPYVFERMLAASYGVAMAAHYDSGQPQFKKKILPEHARRIFDLMFTENAPWRTTHILTREYGRRFIELAVFHNRKLFGAKERARVQPPYSNGGRLDWPDVESRQEEVHGLDSPLRMDFKNYTLGYLADGRGNYDFNHSDFRKIHAQVLWRINQLGWTAEKFKRIDGLIESEYSRYGRAADENHKVDRYGKKYSWIAYFELSGWLQDHKKVKRGRDYERTWDVDIDPSFPLQLPKDRLILDDFLGDPKLKLEDWIENGGVPNVIPYLRMAEIQNQSGPWVTLNGFFTQEDEQRGRRIFCFIRSFFVALKDADAFFTCLTKQDLGGRWLPEIPSVTYTFAGEIPWCDTFPKNGFTEFRFVTEKKRVRVKRKKPVFFLDGKQIELTQFDLHRLSGMPFLDLGEKTGLSIEQLNQVKVSEIFVDDEEIQQQTKKLTARIPVREFGWERRNLENEHISAITLAKEIARSLKLAGQPQTFDLFTKQGTKTSIAVSERRDYNNCQDLYLIREDLLKQYLERKKLVLVWAIWGEREYSTKIATRWQREDSYPKIPYKVYQTIRRYDPRTRRVMAKQH